MIQFSVKWGLPDKLVKPDEHRNTKPATEQQQCVEACAHWRLCTSDAFTVNSKNYLDFFPTFKIKVTICV